MELARALTSRKRNVSDSSRFEPKRAASMRRAGTIKRSAISAPLQLLSTTNVLAFNAPNIYGSSDNESEGSMTFSNSTRATTPENDSPSPVEPNHLSSYFANANRSVSRRSKDSSECDSPAIPQRMPSHTKKSHQLAARKRSIQQSVQPPVEIHSPAAARNSIEMFSHKPDADHPFGAELTKVNELAEEIGAKDVLVLDEEEQYLMSHGFCKFGAEDYLDEIMGLFGCTYNNPFSKDCPVWI
ncbi:MAG: hypothetical protein ASARMPREDX12_002641 [Alectoria sarmentosa]|nr:MAG: hypothetical protein ASARMPREDX12_002641 [Alectoria sarmentosa]CAD6568841.1 MAG: hypothetical protein ASARMPRED_002075 [Alectoria sarmentosa]